MNAQILVSNATGKVKGWTYGTYALTESSCVETLDGATTRIADLNSTNVTVYTIDFENLPVKPQNYFYDSETGEFTLDPQAVNSTDEVIETIQADVASIKAGLGITP